MWSDLQRVEKWWRPRSTCVKHCKKFCSVVGGHLTTPNNPPRKEECNIMLTPQDGGVFGFQVGCTTPSPLLCFMISYVHEKLCLLLNHGPWKENIPKMQGHIQLQPHRRPLILGFHAPTLALSLTYFILTGCYLISFKGWKGFQYPSLCQLINLLQISLCKRSCNMRKLFSLQLWDYFHECLISMEVFFGTQWNNQLQCVWCFSSRYNHSESAYQNKILYQWIEGLKEM